MANIYTRGSNLFCWVAPWCRVEDSKPPQMTIWLTLLYAVAAGFSSANLYYSHPILNVLAEDFHTTQTGVANIPTLAQAGEATCLLLIMPLADFFPRRAFTLFMTSLSVIFWFGLCLVNNLTGFLILTYLSGLFTCIVHIVIPLVSELSSPSRRAFNLSIVGTGPTLGILLARIFSGVVANYTSWRNVYWMSLGIQVCVLLALFLFMPDYAAINKTRVGKVVRDYPRILFSIVAMYGRHPPLVQACFLAFTSFTVLTAYWTTLTFLLATSPYNYGSAAIGLFGLIGAATLLLGPVFGKFVIGPMRVPLYSAILGNTFSLAGVLVGTFVGLHNVAGPILEAVLLDLGIVVVFIATRLSIAGIEPAATNRVNTAFMIALHLGQLVGTKGGNEVYEQHGGWLAAGYWKVGITVAGYLIIALRGPNETGWVGWKGGWRWIQPTDDGSEGDEEAQQTEKVDK